jgi:carbonic anhydrase
MIGCTIMPPIAQADNNQTKNNQAKALVFSCIDFRFLATERYFLSMKNLGNSYDWATLAGGSLALAGFPNSADTQAFWDQLEFSYKQHNIKRVLILDHENCDAYAVKFSPDLLNNKQQELQIHTEYLRQAYWSINTRYPDLNVELYFVTLNNAEVLSISPS